jgi:hypothetical protein
LDDFLIRHTGETMKPPLLCMLFLALVPVASAQTVGACSEQGNCTQRGSLTVLGNGKTGNVALKAAGSDAVQYVSPNGQDSNDGLSAGSAKATIAAAYAVLPTTGGTIHVRGPISVSSPIAFESARKPAFVRCSRGATITFTGTSGALFTLDWGFTNNPITHSVTGGVEGCVIEGSGGKSSAIELGGANGGASGSRLQDDKIVGFATGVQMSQGPLGAFNIVLDHLYFDRDTTDIDLSRPGSENVDITNSNISNAVTGLSVGGNFQVHLFGDHFDANTGTAISVAPASDIHIDGTGLHFENPGGSDIQYITAGGGQDQEIDIFGSTFSNDNSSRTAAPQMVSLNGTTSYTTLRIFGSSIGTCNQPLSNFVNSAARRNVLVLDGVNVACGTVTHLWNRGVNRPTVEYLSASHSRLTFIPPGACGMSLSMNGNSVIALQNLCGYTMTFPNASGMLGLAGANGVSAGTITLSSGSGSHTFPKPYTFAPVCTATDTTSPTKVMVTSSPTAVSVTGAGSDVVAWVCAPSAN